jgi:TetR/AcrR family transcriptional regulator
MNEIIAKRQQAERQERIAKVLNAARKLFFSKGYLNTTIRDIALKARFSTGVIYFYFKGKDDIFGRLCEEGFQILLDLIKKAAQVQGTPLDKIIAIARAYLRFYIEYPEYFNMIIFGDMGYRRIGLSVETQKKLDELTFQVLSVVIEAFEEAIKQGYIDYEGDSRGLPILFWAALHGLIAINERGYLDKYELDFVKLTDIQIELLLKGIVTQHKLHSGVKN